MSDFTDDTEGTWEEGGAVPADAQLYDDQDGSGTYAVDAAGNRWGVVDAPVDEQDALEQVFLEAAGNDPYAAAQNYETFEENMAKAHGVPTAEDDGYLSSEELDSWLADNPIVAANGGLPELMPFYEAAGEDLDAAVALLEHRVEQDRKAAAKVGYSPGGEKPLSMEEAMDSAYADGMLGAAGRQPYVHKPTGDAMENAMGEMREALSLQNAVARQASARVKQARRSG